MKKFTVRRIEYENRLELTDEACHAIPSRGPAWSFRSIKTDSNRTEILRETAVRAYEFAKAIWTMANDTRLGIQTMPRRFRVRKLSVEELDAQHGNDVDRQFDDGAGYESPDYANLRKIISTVRPAQTDVVYDLGCGMGRVLCLFARQGVKKCVGIELFPNLCEIARQNAERLRGNRSQIVIQEGDAATADLTDGTIFFMFNPFGSKTMQTVVANIEASLQVNPRDVKIVYYKDVQEDVLRASQTFRKYNQFDTPYGVRVSFWRNA